MPSPSLLGRTLSCSDAPTTLNSYLPLCILNIDVVRNSVYLLVFYDSAVYSHIMFASMLWTHSSPDAFVDVLARGLRLCKNNKEDRSEIDDNRGGPCINNN